ncbi:MAG: GNAT family N-acetyltransferase [Clostridiales bacterium]|nr:GNAT family N-acetyltransferase [Clostridiales bacterium]
MLVTRRLLIRDPLISDISGWHSLMTDLKAMFFLSGMITRSEKESADSLREIISESISANRAKFFFIVETRDTNAFVGAVGYKVEDGNPSSAHAGYFLLPEFWGNGYATEALKGVIGFAFRRGVACLKAGCFADNKASERVMQKCGMSLVSENSLSAWHGSQLKKRVAYQIVKRELASLPRR